MPHWLPESIRGVVEGVGERWGHVKVKAYKSQNLVTVDSCWGSLGESLTNGSNVLVQSAYLSLSRSPCRGCAGRVCSGVCAVAKSKAASSYQMIYLRARQANKQATMPTVQHGPRQFAASDSDACQIVTSGNTHRDTHAHIRGK